LHFLPIYFLPCPHHIHAHLFMSAHPPTRPAGALTRANSFNFSLSCYLFPPWPSCGTPSSPIGNVALTQS
jgi:hypothetical protein